MSKKVNKLTEPNMRLYFLLAAVFCAVTLWIEPILGLVEAGVMALTYVYFRRTAQKRREGIQRYVEDMTDDVASAGKSSMLSAPFAMMVFRPDTQEVLWSNESFLQLTGMRENLFDNRLEDTLPGFPAQWLLEGKSECPETVVVNNRHFRVFGSLTHPSGRSGARGLLALTYWMDVTEQDELRKKSEENRPIVAVLMLDNYEELMKAGTEAARSSVLAQIDEKISAWVSGTQGLLCKYDRNRYLLLLTEKHYNTLLEGKFSVLDAVRSVVTEDGVAATLSIGVGKDADDYETLFKNAGLSIEMALSRGGDQVVVRNRLDFEFYGGKTKSTEKRTKVKSRVMANALGELISDASQVFIMGHKHADFDAVGAAAGVCCIARKRGKKAQIVIDMDDNAAGPILKRSRARIIAETQHDIIIRIPLEEAKLVPSGRIISRPVFRFFGLSIPLYTDGPIEGEFIEEFENNPLTANGLRLPIGMATQRYILQEMQTITRTPEQAAAEAAQQLEQLTVERTAEGIELIERTTEESIENGEYILIARDRCREDICREEPILISENGT